MNQISNLHICATSVWVDYYAGRYDFAIIVGIVAVC